MLVLTRKTGGRLLIGADVAITVLEVQGNRVRIGVEAPAGVVVLRAELASPPAPQHTLPAGTQACVLPSAAG